MDNIKDKIRKLLAVAHDKGASEEEAATAMRLAMTLMARHGIEQSQLGAEKPKVHIDTVTAEATKKYELRVAMAAGILYGCNLIAKNGGNDGFFYVGRPANIEAAELTYPWLLDQVEALYKAALPKGLSQTDRAEYRRTFKAACAERIYMRAIDLVKNPTAIEGSTALVVQGYFNELAAENRAAIESQLKIKPMRMGFRLGNGSVDGARAGERVKLRQEVNRTEAKRLT